VLVAFPRRSAAGPLERKAGRVVRVPGTGHGSSVTFISGEYSELISR